jgi:hypothetical protein
LQHREIDVKNCSTKCGILVFPPNCEEIPNECVACMARHIPWSCFSMSIKAKEPKKKITGKYLRKITENLKCK